MTKRWVLNASPLIILGKISRLELLAALTDELVIPKAVVQEIEQGTQNDPSKLWLAQTGHDFIKDTAPMNSVIAGWDLGAGESHVLTSLLSKTIYRNVRKAPSFPRRRESSYRPTWIPAYAGMTK